MRTGSLPLILIGTALVILALWRAPWPADLLKSIPNYSVSHQERMLGRDLPEGATETQRPDGYSLFRIFDGLVYFALVQVVMATALFLWTGQRFLLLLVMVAGLYGALYSITLGLVIGPQMAYVGFSGIFFAALLSWMTGENNGTHSVSTQRDSQHTGI